MFLCLGGYLTANLMEWNLGPILTTDPCGTVQNSCRANKPSIVNALFQNRGVQCDDDKKNTKNFCRLVLCSIVCHQHFSFWMTLCVLHNMDIGKKFAWRQHKQRWRMVKVKHYKAPGCDYFGCTRTQKSGTLEVIAISHYMCCDSIENTCLHLYSCFKSFT